MSDRTESSPANDPGPKGRVRNFHEAFNYTCEIKNDANHSDYGLLALCRLAGEFLCDGREATKKSGIADLRDEQRDDVLHVLRTIRPQTLAGQLGILAVRANEIEDILERATKRSVEGKRTKVDLDQLESAVQRGLYACAIAAEALRYAARGEFWNMAGVI